MTIFVKTNDVDAQFTTSLSGKKVLVIFNDYVLKESKSKSPSNSAQLVSLSDKLVFVLRYFTRW